MTSALFVLVTIQFAFGLAGFAFTILHPLYDEFTTAMPYYIVTLAIGSAAGILLMAIWVFLLAQSRGSIFSIFTSPDGMKQTDCIVGKITSVIISTGALTTLTEAIIFWRLAFYRNNLIYWSVFLLLGHLYAISALTTLNARISFPTDCPNNVVFSGGTISTGHAWAKDKIRFSHAASTNSESTISNHRDSDFISRSST